MSLDCASVCCATRLEGACLDQPGARMRLEVPITGLTTRTNEHYTHSHTHSLTRMHIHTHTHTRKHTLQEISISRLQCVDTALAFVYAVCFVGLVYCIGSLFSFLLCLSLYRSPVRVFLFLLLLFLLLLASYLSHKCLRTVMARASGDSARAPRSTIPSSKPSAGAARCGASFLFCLAF